MEALKFESVVFANLQATVEEFLNHGKGYEFEKNSYSISYPEFLAYFKNLNEITKHNLIIGIHFTYGWMPTIFDFRSDKFEDALTILNNAKVGKLPTAIDLELLKKLFNNSLVGTSKILHFINPEKFAIWDSRVYHYLTGEKPYDHRIGNCKAYLDYLLFCEYLVCNDSYELVHSKIVGQVGYPMTKFRTAELIMFSNGTKEMVAKHSNLS